ncbi:hypothetical protein [Lysobacter gummosus]|uniref:hypothetical protein n=1 Tax=Lysobacter gummosus TaxID=262324 RepID=UPI003642860A
MIGCAGAEGVGRNSAPVRHNRRRGRPGVAQREKQIERRTRSLRVHIAGDIPARRIEHPDRPREVADAGHAILCVVAKTIEARRLPELGVVCEPRITHTQQKGQSEGIVRCDYRLRRCRGVNLRGDEESRACSAE